MTKKAKRYSEEFKAEAVKTIENNGGNVNATARQLQGNRTIENSCFKLDYLN